MPEGLDGAMDDERGHIFRAYDIRGVFNKDLTVDVAARIGEVFAAFLGHKGVVAVGRDVRVSSAAMEAAVVSGLVAGGCKSFAVGPCPIPVFNFHVSKGEYDAGIYITASHNPPEYNGIRFRNPDGSGYTDKNERIKQMYLEGDFDRPPWNEVGKAARLPEGQAVEEYTAFLRARLTTPKKLRIVVDPGNGAAAKVASDLIYRIGHEVIPINDEADGTFPSRSPHPTEKSLGALMAEVGRQKADLGVGYDGDGDRCVFVDDRGRVVQTEKIGIIIARDALKERKGKVIVNVPCSMIVEDELAKEGAEVVRVRVGDVFVCEEIKRQGGVFAMEISAHFFLPQYYIFDDPILTTVKLMEIMGKLGRPLSELVDDIPSYPFVEDGFPTPDDVKFKVNDMLLEHFRRKGAKVDTTDGVKVIYKDGWAMLRPSNTQPLTRMFAEARTKKRLEQLVKQFKALFEQTLERARGGGKAAPARPKAPARPAAVPRARAAKAPARPKKAPSRPSKPQARPRSRPRPKPKAPPKPKARPRPKPRPKAAPRQKAKPAPKKAAKAKRRAR